MKFYRFLEKDLARKNIDFSEFYDSANAVEKRILEEYGALFVARGGAIVPAQIIFKSESEVSAFQKSVSITKENIGGFELELQTAAMNDLLKSIADAEKNDLTITPRAADSARRNYAQTVELWASRVVPALEHWTKEGKLNETDAAGILALAPFEQVPVIFKLEEKGIFFSKDLSKSIVYSVAPPGTSQHLSMLAFDVAEYKNERVRKILALNGWFQTVVSDLPHFTYLGADEKEFPNLGLKKVENCGQAFWIPNI
ncbi:MAG TPA: hypothetical protein VF692_11845 [Pyrinomonadaceae bacterium]